MSFGTSLLEDLRRRDFTINAMAVRLPQVDFVDPFDGLADLAARRLRTPATPEESFADDPLRMMRAARFTAQLGVSVAPEVAEAMTEMADRITLVSAERVRDELTKLLLAQGPGQGWSRWSTPGWPPTSCPSCLHCGWRWTSTTGTRTSTSTP